MVQGVMGFSIMIYKLIQFYLFMHEFMFEMHDFHEVLSKLMYYTNFKV